MSVAWERVRAVCFDMDGTLVDSDPLWLNATRAAFARFGLTLTDEQYGETLGLDNASGVKAVLRHFPHFPQDPMALARALEEAVQVEFRKGIRPMPGAVELLDRWVVRWPLALVSTSSAALMDSALDGLGWGRYFVLRLSSEQVGPGKPDPAVYLEAARRLGVEPAQALAVEDSVNGARAAQAAGMQVIGVASDPVLAARLLPVVTELESKLNDINTMRSRDPLHGVTLARMLEELVENYGWNQLGFRIPIRCFMLDPSISSSLKFLRRTPWARAKVESLYGDYKTAKNSERSFEECPGKGLLS